MPKEKVTHDELIIGRYKISVSEIGDHVHISHEDGEYGGFNINDFEACIDKFFSENF